MDSCFLVHSLRLIVLSLVFGKNILIKSVNVNCFGFLKFSVGGAILGVQFLDPLAGLLVSGMILKAGVETGYQR